LLSDIADLAASSLLDHGVETTVEVAEAVEEEGVRVEEDTAEKVAGATSAAAVAMAAAAEVPVAEAHAALVPP